MKIRILLVIAVRCFLLTATEDDVQIPPLITKSPPAYVTYLPGKLLLLECKAEGSPDVRYTWTKNGAELKDIRESHILKYSATADDEGIYQCAATNRYGRDISDKSHVQMEYFRNPTEAQHKWEITVMEGMPFTLFAPRVESFPKARIRWWMFIPGRGIFHQISLASGRLQIDENGDLYFAFAMQEDTLGSYVPAIGNKAAFHTGNKTNITVRTADANWVGEAPIIRHYDGPVVALVGRNASFRCIYSGYPYPAITWTLPGNSRLTSRHELNFNGTELFISYVQTSDEGNYVCTASNSVGKMQQDFNLRVEAVPSFKRKSDRPHNIDAMEDSTVTFVCNADAKPEASIDWFYNGELIDANKPLARIEISDNRESLTIKYVRRKCEDRETKTDLMVIQCNASNTHGYSFASGYLNIVPPPTYQGAMYVVWWVVLVSTLSFGALLLLVGLGIGLRCKPLSKYRAVASRNKAVHNSRITSDSLYEIIRDAGASIPCIGGRDLRPVKNRGGNRRKPKFTSIGGERPAMEAVFNSYSHL